MDHFWIVSSKTSLFPQVDVKLIFLSGQFMTAFAQEEWSRKKLTKCPPKPKEMVPMKSCDVGKSLEEVEITEIRPQSVDDSKGEKGKLGQVDKIWLKQGEIRSNYDSPEEVSPNLQEKGLP